MFYHFTSSTLAQNLTEKMETSNSKAKLPFWVLISLLLATSQLVVSHSTVLSLPGFQEPLPFELETGYVGVDESEDVQLFYYFVKSESDPKEDPLILWLTGGPGCSSLSGLIYEMGPLQFGAVHKDGGLPTLVLNPNSWSKVASIIFLDLPVGAGFSYARTSHASQSTDFQACSQAYQFLKKWLMDHPEFVSNPFYMGGDSYSGQTVPVVTQLISTGIEAGTEPLINLKGYLLGNPSTFPEESNYRIPFAHGMGLISDELYEMKDSDLSVTHSKDQLNVLWVDGRRNLKLWSLQGNCKGEYFNAEPSNTQCLKDVEVFNECTSRINANHILEPFCDSASPRPTELLGRRSLYEINKELLVHESSPCSYSRDQGYRLSHSWCNDDSVREALHIRKGSTGEWVRCNYGLPFTRTYLDSFQYHVNLSTKGYRSLIYSGDHDLGIPFLSTQAWIRSLNYSIVDDWRMWVVEGQIAGYTRTYSNGMTFATIKGGGHIAPEYRQVECYAMFKRWISQQPL